MHAGVTYLQVQLKGALMLAVVLSGLLGISSMTAYAGGVFITGHDPDYHAIAGGNTLGAQHIIQRAVVYVTFDKPNPKILLVTDVRNPGGDQIDSRLGMTAAGFSFDVADYGSGTSGVLDLHTVNFNNYDAIVVASDSGGWLRQDELDILNARATELIDYVNTGNRGIVGFNESGNRPGGPGIYTGTTHNRYGFLPFLVSGVGFQQPEVGITLTAAGEAIGLTNTDVNGNAAHSVFTATGGMDIIDVDSSGQILSLATRKFITPQGVADHFKCYEAQGEPVNVIVDLQDQFGEEPRVLVGKPKLFCNPVDKNGEGISHPTLHLTCYEIEADNEEERNVIVKNQFGEQTLKVEKPKLLCVPPQRPSSSFR